MTETEIKINGYIVYTMSKFNRDISDFLSIDRSKRDIFESFCIQFPGEVVKIPNSWGAPPLCIHQLQNTGKFDGRYYCSSYLEQTNSACWRMIFACSPEGRKILLCLVMGNHDYGRLIKYAIKNIQKKCKELK